MLLVNHLPAYTGNKRCDLRMSIANCQLSLRYLSIVNCHCCQVQGAVHHIHQQDGQDGSDAVEGHRWTETQAEPQCGTHSYAHRKGKLPCERIGIIVRSELIW